MKKRVVMIALVFLPILVWCMEPKDLRAVGMLISADEQVQCLEHEPIKGSLVVIRYDGHYQWGLVRGKAGNEFSIIQKQEGNKSHGFLLPLSALYELIQKEEK